jgi:raffinose/stachyose/melibiose transport system permease protein
MKYKILKKRLIDFSFLLPALIIFLGVIFIPFIQGFGIAFTNWNGFSPTSDFTGLKNFFDLFKDIKVANAAKNTVVYTILTCVGVNLLAIVICVGLNNTKLKGSRFLKSAMFAPIITSLVIAAFMWKRIFGEVFPEYFNLASPLTYTNTVIPGISLVCLWRDTGLAMIIYNANILSIPQSLNEAAVIDGANKWRIFRHITFPLLAPAFTTCVTLWLGYGIKVFDYPYVIVTGGMGKAAQTLGVFVYTTFFTNNKAGYGQMAALVLLILVVIVTTIATRLLRKREVAA